MSNRRFLSSKAIAIALLVVASPLIAACIVVAIQRLGNPEANQAADIMADPKLAFVTQCSNGSTSERENRVYCTCVTTMAADISDNYANPIAEHDASTIVGQCMVVTDIWRTMQANREVKALPEIR